MTGTLDPNEVCTKLRRIAKLARETPKRAFVSLAHHIDIEFLREAFRRTRKDGATGVDGQTAAEYERDLEHNLESLHERLKSGRYYAPPVRRTHIPKRDGTTRPLGIPTFEDKVLQRAITMVLEAVYEQDFLDCSHGYRPRRSPHTALNALWKRLMEMGGGWVLEIDIAKFFDTLDHARLRSFLDQRVRDGVLRRTINKWLKAGVMEDGNLSRSDTGTPQGGVVSPILANVYLHEVLDTWFAEQVQPQLLGRSFLVRFADDSVIVFSNEQDARRVLAALPARFERFGLKLHPVKTRLLYFRPPSDREPPRGGPRSFDFLGFTHFWARSRKGRPFVQRKTAADRFRRTAVSLNQWLRDHRHQPVRDQHKALSAKLRGHYAYYGLPANRAALGRLRNLVSALWYKWLNRRSTRGMTWQRFSHLKQRYPLPQPTMLRHA